MNADPSVEAAKAALRAEARARRSSLSPKLRAEAARAVADRLIPALSLSDGVTVAAYWPIGGELDCRPLADRLREQGCRLCLPVVAGAELPLLFRAWTSEMALVPSGFGTVAPPADADPVEPDIVLLPLLGFDQAGTRLGYGGGHYDRTLASLVHRPERIGLGFAIQEFDHIPRLPHDVPLHAAMTERGLMRFAPRKLWPA